MSKHDDETRIDWFRVIVDLSRQGVSLYGIQCATGINKSTLSGYKSGAEPRHSDGELLLGLWISVMQKGREDAPVEKRYRIARGR